MRAENVGTIKSKTVGLNLKGPGLRIRFTPKRKIGNQRTPIKVSSGSLRPTKSIISNVPLG
jgi:hypothetical protein